MTDAIEGSGMSACERSQPEPNTVQLIAIGVLGYCRSEA
jgi:hypothetical protein